MAEDVTSLVLKVESSQVSKASKELSGLSTSSTKAEKATDGVTKAFKGLIGPLLAAVSATAALKKLVSVTREFDILNAQLITATGSAEGAAVAFGAIQQFAVDTPFQLGEVTEAFVQLVNRGLDPSEESLVNIGNFASAFGRNILDATRAIGQATTGEFESLKQFGIVSRKIGDEVNFTFRGITTTVGFNAKEIQGYMNDLAANNFAGAMEERMNSLDGAISNLEDSWDKFWLTVSQGGSGDVIQEWVRGAIFVIEDLTSLLDSESDMQTSLGEITTRAEDIRDAFRTTGLLLNRSFKGWEVIMKSAQLGIVGFANSFTEDLFPVIAAFGSKMEAITGKDFGLKELGYIGEGILQTKVQLIGELNTLLTNFETVDEDFLAQFDKVLKDNDGGSVLGQFMNSGDLGGFTDSSLKAFEKLRFGLLDEQEKLAKVFEDQQNSLDALMSQGNIRLENIAEARAEALSGDVVDVDVLQSLQNQNTQTLQIIEDANQAKLDLEVAYQEELDALKGDSSGITSEFERLQESLMTEEEAIEASYQRRMETAQEYATLTGESVAEIESRIQKAHEADLKSLEKQKWDNALASFDDFQQNMLVLSKTGNKELAAVYKAGAIANATIKTYEAANVALASAPPPFNIALAGIAVAAGMANVSAIATQQVGNYAHGGIVGGGNYNGDNMTANVNSGEMILNFSQQKELLGMANGSGGSSKPIVVNVQNYGSGETEVTETETDNERIINIAVNRAVATINNNIRTGAGDTEKALKTRDKRPA